MYSYVLQDWLTIRNTTTTPVIQNENEWLGFSSFQDVVFWIDIRERTTSGTLTLELQTSPTKDGPLFQTLSNCSITTSVATPFLNAGALPKSVVAAAPGVALATWVRWRLTNSAASIWDITFRIILSANRTVAAV